ncbi:MAG: TadE/TadG family type IV pilus assembly protein [Pseudomonadota bacterium]
MSRIDPKLVLGLKRAKGLPHRLRRDKSGMAATEFAMILPMLVLLFFGLVEGSDAMTANRRVALTTNTLADLIAQSEQLSFDEADALITGALAILEPADTNTVTINLVSVVLDDDDDPVVHWSRDKNGATPYAVDSDFTELQEEGVLTDFGSVIVVEVTYPFASGFSDQVIKSPITFNRMAIRWPRLSTRVQLCDNNMLNCTS